MAEADVDAAPPEPSLSSAFGVVLDPRSYRNVLYMAVSFPIGLSYLIVLTVGLALGAGLSVIVVGIPILLGTILLARPIAVFERALANVLLGTDIDGPRDLPADAWDDPLATIQAALGARSTWAALGFCVLRFWFGVVAFVLVVATTAFTLALLTAPLTYRSPAIGLQFGAWSIDTLPEALAAVPVGVLAGVASLHLLNATVAAWTVVVRWFLGTTQAEPGAAEFEGR